MATGNPETSEHYSFHETASSYPVLDIINNNLFLNLEQVLLTGSKYFDSSFKSIFVCLKHSKISTALTLHCSVPISVLSRAYATARYDKSAESMHFNLSTNKSTSITKQHFYKLLNLPFSADLTHPDSISNCLDEQVQDAPRWNLLSSIVLRCFAERTTGSDNASNLLLTLIYVIYTNQNIDIGHILWTQFCLSPNSCTRTSNISMARFLSIIVDGALSKFVDLRGDDTTVMAEISELQVNKLGFVKDRVFPHCGEIPSEMWSLVTDDEPQKKKVKKDNKGALPPLVPRQIPADVQERIEALVTKKPQAKRKMGEVIETEQVQPEPEKTTPKKQKKKTIARKSTKKPKKKPTLVDESSDDEATLSDHHSEPKQEQPTQTEAGTSNPEGERDTTFDNLGNIEKLTQTPPVPPNEEEQTHDKEQTEQTTNKPSPTGSESEEVDENIEMEQPPEDLFNANQPSTSYIPPVEKFSFLPVTFEDEPMSTEQEDLFATKKDNSSLRSKMNAIIAGMDLSKFNQKEETVKKHLEEVKEIRKELLTSISTLQADFTSKVSDVEKKIDGIAQKATTDSELKAKLHAQEIRVQELETQLESKTHEADHRQRVIDMYKAQNQEFNP
ncbi:hypothetical protein LXL04_003811 [Taraxacum kok-saghyz]